MRNLMLSLGLLASACGPKPSTPSQETMLLGQPCAMKSLAMPESDESAFGPLEVGADWKSYKKLNREPVPSKTHGGRFVDTYVNDVGVAAYGSDDAEVPVGTVIVKTSVEGKDGHPSDVPGPIFVMKKMERGYAPDHDDWYFAIHWEHPTEAQLKLLKGPIYWRGRSPKVGYCYKCHDNYVRSLGGVPAEYRAP
jgi:Cytochrome P460